MVYPGNTCDVFSPTKRRIPFFLFVVVADSLIVNEDVSKVDMWSVASPPFSVTIMSEDLRNPFLFLFTANQIIPHVYDMLITCNKDEIPKLSWYEYEIKSKEFIVL